MGVTRFSIIHGLFDEDENGKYCLHSDLTKASDMTDRYIKSTAELSLKVSELEDAILLLRRHNERLRRQRDSACAQRDVANAKLDFMIEKVGVRHED